MPETQNQATEPSEHAAIRARRAAGADVTDLAREYRLSIPLVLSILREAPRTAQGARA